MLAERLHSWGQKALRKVSKLQEAVQSDTIEIQACCQTKHGAYILMLASLLVKDHAFRASICASNSFSGVNASMILRPRERDERPT